jgi:hypothetical protein
LLLDAIQGPFFACPHIDSGNSTSAYEVADLLSSHSELLGNLFGCKKQLGFCGSLLFVVAAW